MSKEEFSRAVVRTSRSWDVSTDFMLHATGRRVLPSDQGAIRSMDAENLSTSRSWKEGEKVTVVFFFLESGLSAEEVAREYFLRGLRPVAPYILTELNIEDPSFADEFTNATQWRDGNRWHYAVFGKCQNQRLTRASSCFGQYSEPTWFAGQREV
jgi:hypothetical protein